MFVHVCLFMYKCGCSSVGMYSCMRIFVPELAKKGKCVCLCEDKFVYVRFLFMYTCVYVLVCSLF